MVALALALLPSLVKIIAYLVDQNQLNTEQKKAFMSFVQTMSQGENSSKKYKDEFDELHKKLRGEL